MVIYKENIIKVLNLDHLVLLSVVVHFLIVINILNLFLINRFHFIKIIDLILKLLYIQAILLYRRHFSKSNARAMICYFDYVVADGDRLGEDLFLVHNYWHIRRTKLISIVYFLVFRFWIWIDSFQHMRLRFENLWIV